MSEIGEFYLSTGDYENPILFYIYDKINNDYIAYVINKQEKIIYYDDIWPENLIFENSFIKKLKDKNKYRKYFIKTILNTEYIFKKGD